MDLTSPRLIYLKRFLFGVILAASLGLIALLTRDWLVVGLAALAAWAAARGCYFMFYVIGRYVDPSYRFAGVLSFARYVLSRRT